MKAANRTIITLLLYDIDMYSLYSNLNLTEVLAPPIIPGIEYTPFNIFLYAGLLGLVASWLMEKDLSRPTAFSYLAGFPYMLLGGAYFSLASTGRGLTGLLGISVSVSVCLMLWEEINESFQLLIVATGYLWSLALIYVSLPSSVIYTVLICALPVVAITGVLVSVWDRFSKSVMAGSAHLLDAVTTAVGLQYGLEETMFPAKVFVQYLGAPGVFVLKALLIPAVIYGAWQIEEKDRDLVLFTVYMIGVAVSARNLFML